MRREHTWDAGVRENVRVAQAAMRRRETPVALPIARFVVRHLPSSVVVIDEGDGALGPPTDEPRRFSTRIAKAPELPAVHRLLQNCFGSKVKGVDATPSRVEPVTRRLPHRILISCEHAPLLPCRLRPVLSDIEPSLRLRDVLPYERGAKAFDVVEPKPLKANLFAQPREPALHRRPNTIVRMIQIRRCVVQALPRIRLALAVEHAIVSGDGPRAPRALAVGEGSVAEDVPYPGRILRVGAAMVHDNVCEARHAARAQRLHQIHKLIIRPIR
mmetsp:Transcript_15499/g.50959  ORF Transcript_15499/g.50959 Transcript_15499/m.50959 type:complete len:272 (+) Transcript_15499:338-1153(+)